MFWDKKEDSKLPDLPPIKSANRSLPNLPSESSSSQEVEKNSLPSFPNSPGSNKFQEVAIKDAISSPRETKMPAFPTEEISSDTQDPEKFKTIEMEEWNPPTMPSDRSVNPETIPEVPRQTPKTQSPPIANAPVSEPKAQDIFVKIDKFRTVRKTLKDTQEKLEEIDSLLSKIRETKMREEQELTSWEKEISLAKSRIQEVTSNIFEKVK